MSAHSKNLGWGMLAGMAGGLSASWLMNKFMAGPGKKLQRAMAGGDSQSKPAEPEKNDEEKEDATMKAADAVVHLVSGRRLSHEDKSKGGPIVHYAFGGLMGAVYGGLAEYCCFARAGFGTVFGAALFVGADPIAVPALKFSGSSTGQPASAWANPLAAHLVYGASTEAVRRVLRSLL